MFRRVHVTALAAPKVRGQPGDDTRPDTSVDGDLVIHDRWLWPRRLALQPAQHLVVSQSAVDLVITDGRAVVCGRGGSVEVNGFRLFGVDERGLGDDSVLELFGTKIQVRVRRVVTAAGRVIEIDGRSRRYENALRIGGQPITLVLDTKRGDSLRLGREPLRLVGAPSSLGFLAKRQLTAGEGEPIAVSDLSIAYAYNTAVTTSLRGTLAIDTSARTAVFDLVEEVDVEK